MGLLRHLRVPISWKEVVKRGRPCGHRDNVLGWKIAQWPLVAALFITGVVIVSYVVPDVKQEWVWISLLVELEPRGLRHDSCSR
jgi:hypothetical protein